MAGVVISAVKQWKIARGDAGIYLMGSFLHQVRYTFFSGMTRV